MELKIGISQLKELLKGNSIELTYVEKTEPTCYDSFFPSYKVPTLISFDMSIDKQSLNTYHQEVTYGFKPKFENKDIYELEQKVHVRDKTIEMYERVIENLLSQIENKEDN